MTTCSFFVLSFIDLSLNGRDSWDSLLCVENPFQWDISLVLSEKVNSFTNWNANNANQVYFKNILPWIGLHINRMNSWYSLLCNETLYRMVNGKGPVEPKAPIECIHGGSVEPKAESQTS